MGRKRIRVIDEQNVSQNVVVGSQDALLETMEHFNASHLVTTSDNFLVLHFDSLEDGCTYKLGFNSKVAPEGRRTRPKHNPPSPGAQLDAATDYTILGVAVDAYQDVLAEVVVPRSPFRRPDLQAFTKAEIGHTQNNIDMRLTKTFDDSTHAGKALCDRLAAKLNVILLGRSGCGKTTAIFDACHKYYCLLFTTSSVEMRESSHYMDPGGFDLSFSMLVEDLSRCLKIPDKTDNNKELECERLIEAFIVARLLLLFKFKQLDGASSFLWLVYQLENGGESSSKLYRSLRNRSTQTLRNLRGSLNDQLSFFFYAFDEAQIGYKLLKDDQMIWKSTQEDNPEKRGMGCPLVRRLMTDGKPVVAAGTAMSLGSADSVLSDLGKNESTRVITDFPTLSLEEVKDNLDIIIVVNDVDLDKIPFLWKLEGRGRLFGGLLSALKTYLEDNIQKGGTKYDIFALVVEDHYNTVLTKLVERVRDAFPKTKDPIMAESQPPVGLSKLAVASLWGGTVSFSAEEFDQDLLHVGLCSVKKIQSSPEPRVGSPTKSTESYSFILDEQLGKEAILCVAKGEQSFVDAFKSVVSFCQPATGHAAEPLLVGELMHWCKDASRKGDGSKSVHDLLTDLFDENELPVDLPDWARTSRFSVESSYDKKSFIGGGFSDDVDFIQTSISNPLFQNRLLSPSTIKRPDFEAVMHSEWTPWFLSVSSKLYSRQYNDSTGGDLRSTKPTKFYCKQNGEENGNCKKLRKKWKKLMEENSKVFERCVRIHFCLPSVKQSSDANGSIWVDSDDKSIVLYITAANVRNIFQEKTINLLEQLGYLERQS